MFIKDLNEKNKIIKVAIPLTNGTGKTRIKKRSFFNEYGIPVSTKNELFSQLCYVEWQIGYDVPIKDDEKLKLTTIKDNYFTGANGKIKTFYELSEYIFYFYKWNIILKENLLEIRNFLIKLSNNDFIDNPSNFAIERNHPVEKNVLGINFFLHASKIPNVSS